MLMSQIKWDMEDAVLPFLVTPRLREIELSLLGNLVNLVNLESLINVTSLSDRLGQPCSHLVADNVLHCPLLQNPFQSLTYLELTGVSNPHDLGIILLSSPMLTSLTVLMERPNNACITHFEHAASHLESLSLIA